MSDLSPADIADQFGIQGLAVKDGVTTLTTKPTSEEARELVLAMSLACGRMLDDDQAPNYVEFEVQPAGHPGYIVHVRRQPGRSPHSLRLEAEKRAERAEAIVERVREYVDELTSVLVVGGSSSEQHVFDTERRIGLMLNTLIRKETDTDVQ
ncbi:hypothetical protein NONO_c60180 [Nocardia nova SH22a]|uniref:Uncharacterized protein n=1 Tax=Nocardia nova SH22a TaxID=1415166 RepID=W5TNQ3_9NOCA|nr:hypothetical protein [Nocardia nova]AHH20794.1 hypothetical protein NONO_c60180 [Nocardia nova SH22a]